MRRIVTGIAMAALMAVVPTLALAGNQEVAEQIAKNLRSSGQLTDYKIGVKFQDGTAWVRGRVSDQTQMNTALRLVFQTPGVNRVVNDLTVASDSATEEASQAQTADSSTQNPLRDQKASKSWTQRLGGMIGRHAEQPSAGQADQVASSFSATSARTVSAEESTEVPQPMAVPSRVKPMAQTQVAMQSARGPSAPNGGPLPMYTAANGAGAAPARCDQPNMPNYAWPSYAAYPNYAAVTYPKQYSPTAWPYIGPFYPYPQVPMGWRKVTLEWDDGWWFLDFKDQPASCWRR
ncbi:MAG: BON domain-containing protein [Thermoguttaceae bacterium]